METVSDIKLTHSESRPRSAAWCAAAGRHIIYAPTREEASDRLRTLIEAYAGIDASIKACAAISGTAG